MTLTEASKALAEAMNASPSYLEKVDDLLIDPQTGEIIEFPEGLQAASERLAWLAHEYKEATNQENEWKAAKIRYAIVMERLLREMDWTAIKTERYIVRWQPGYNKAHMENLPKAQANFELSDEDVNLIILQCASALDAKRLELQAQSRPDLKDALMSLIEPTKGFIRVERLRREAPAVERITA